MYADVHVGYPLEPSFTYRIPEEFRVLPGMRVQVPFARRSLMGYVVKIHENEPEEFEARDITGVLDEIPIFDERLVELCRFVADSYCSYTGEVMALALPSGKRPSDRYRIPFEKTETAEVLLTDRQREILEEIISGEEKGSLAHCLFGITGSGKTEIYIEMARRTMARGRSVLYLVPEISLSSQIYERLYSVFGDDLVIYHSQLTANQRLHNWTRFYSGDAKIAIGTRSASFMQAPDLGLIIIDEEHDASFKEHSSPRYNARRVALRRGRTEKAIVLMGSATPSVETLYAAEKGLFALHRLNDRYGEARLPAIEVVKLNKAGAGDMISPALKLRTKQAVDAGRQAIYLLNRRGFSPIVMCDACGAVMECPHCNISLNLHRGGDMLCHYCGFQRRMPEVCEKCGSEELVKLGSGTQRIEELIADTFSGFRVRRLDHDSAGRKGAVFKMIQEMKGGEIDILLGTQMVAKGFDFPRVSVVGVLMADIGLNLPDFRAAERIFSLLVQVAGRCGRGKDSGTVILQTRDENHPIFRHIGTHDYYGFYRAELEQRRMLMYPPFSGWRAFLCAEIQRRPSWLG